MRGLAGDARARGRRGEDVPLPADVDDLRNIEGSQRRLKGAHINGIAYQHYEWTSRCANLKTQLQRVGRQCEHDRNSTTTTAQGSMWRAELNNIVVGYYVFGDGAN